MKLQYKILLGVLPIVIISIFSVGLLASYEATKYITFSTYRYMDIILTTYIADNLEHRNKILEKSGLQEIDTFVNVYKKEALKAAPLVSHTLDEHLTIMDSEGNVLFSSGDHNKFLSRAEIDRLIKRTEVNRDDILKGSIEHEGVSELYIASYFGPWDWLIYFSIHDSYIKAAEQYIQNAIFGASTLFSIFTVLIIFSFSRKYIVNPLDNLKTAALKVSNREIVDNVEVKSKDELGELARSMESMSSSIQDYQAQAKNWQTQLEVNVIQRTKELSDSNEALVQEIEQRKKIAADLLRSEDKFRTYYEKAPMGYQSLDENGCFIDVNEAWLEALQYSRDEVIGRSFADFLAPGYRDKFRENFPCFKDAGEILGIEFEMVRKDGAHAIMAINGRIGYDEKGEFKQTHCILNEITERKQLEEEINKAHKLESIGILAGGIAHDFNNILAGILNNIYLSKMQVDHKSDIYQNLETSEKAINSASKLTQQLLTFSKGGAPVKKTTSIIDIIKESAEFALRGSNVNCEYEIADNILPVEIDEGQINQVMHNLILNADQSMPDGGKILIHIDNSEPDSRSGLPLQEGRYVKVVIKDKGIGISEEQLRKVFDPYFTTKEMGRGLGLAIVYSIIKQHGGHISVESVLGDGTTFTIYLPASVKQIEVQEFVRDTLIAGEGKILIMDDEKIIRDSVGEFLTFKGYEVEHAKDGEEAIGLFRKAMDELKPFDVVLLDLTIRGGMGGKEVVKKLLEIDPGVKAVVSSGYSNDPVMANHKEYGFSDVFFKAATPDDLCRILQKLT